MMPFISYAQNGEDVILWRALGDIAHGFYIDVGACDPDEDSVTKAFYERGWRGLNIEPERQYYDRCVAERPRDTNLNVAIMARSGIARFMAVSGRGLSTTVDAAADAAAARGWSVEAVEVPALSLADICATAVVGEIHFLKIDVEGGEAAVLEGADFERFRPWVVVVEATVPNSTERNEHLWEDLLLRARYERVLFDGLNLYYVAREHAGLTERLAAPANVLDGYKHVHAAAAEQRIAHLAAEAAAAQGSLAQTQAALEDLRQQHEAMEQQAAQRVEAQAVEAAQQIASLAAEAEAGRRGLEEAQEAARRLLQQSEALRAANADLEETLARTGQAAQDEIAALRSRLAHQEGSAQRALEFATRRLAQSRREVAELDDRTQAQQGTIEAVEDALRPLARGGSVEERLPLAERLKLAFEEQAEAIALLRSRCETLETACADLRLHRDKILTSNSWRVSAPFRKIRTAVRIARHEPHLVVPLMRRNLRRHHLAEIAPLRLEISTERRPPARPHPPPAIALPEQRSVEESLADDGVLDHGGQVVALIRRDIAERRLAEP